MNEKIYNFASYNLLNLHSPAIGHEIWHCDMKRGFFKARNKEEKVKAILKQDNIPQRIGLLAQQGVYEFHQDNCLDNADSIAQVKEKIKLDQELTPVQNRVAIILKNYYENPILKSKKIIFLHRGDEGYPQPILIDDGNYQFNLYASIDCLFEEEDGTIHILDLKTGTSDFDLRQGYIYLLAAQYLYPQNRAVASFYNLETQKWSEKITASIAELQKLEEKLKQLAQKHQQELKNYKYYQQEFDRVFPPNSGIACRFCQFSSVCEYALIEKKY